MPVARLAELLRSWAVALAASAALVLAFTAASVSPHSVRRSEWPRIT